MEAFPDYFSVSVEEGDEVHTVSLHGELDMASGPQLEKFLRELAGSTLVVELSGLRFIDSSGFGALIRARRAVEAEGHSVVFRGTLAPEVAVVFENIGIAITE